MGVREWVNSSPAPRRGDAVRRARTAAIAALVYGAGLAYLSVARGGEWACGATLLFEFSSLSKASRADLVVNVVAYVPFGVMVALSCRSAGAARIWAAFFAALFGGLLSLSVELVQACLPARTSSWLDLAANAGGALLGSALYLAELRPVAIGDARGGRSRALLAAEPLRSLAALTLLAWFAGRTFPWVLTADIGQIRQNLVFLKPLLAGEPSIDPWRLAGNLAQWIVAGVAVRALLRPWAPVFRLTLAMMLLALAVQLLLAVPTLSLEQLLSFVIAIAILLVLRLPASAPALPAALALAAVSMATTYQLRPGRGPVSGEFSWWPVFGTGNPIGALELGVFFFAFAFACALALAWSAMPPAAGPKPALAARAVLPSPGATIVGASLSIAWLAMLEVAQLWVPGRTADTSTPLLALTGWAIALAVQSRATDPAPTRRPRSAP